MPTKFRLHRHKLENSPATRLFFSKKNTISFSFPGSLFRPVLPFPSPYSFPLFHSIFFCKLFCLHRVPPPHSPVSFLLQRCGFRRKYFQHKYFPMKTIYIQNYNYLCFPKAKTSCTEGIIERTRFCLGRHSLWNGERRRLAPKYTRLPRRRPNALYLHNNLKRNKWNLFVH